MNRLDRIKGCLLGGAVGDALGAPVEFMNSSAIHERFGPRGITDFAPAYGLTGAITDDTQMMLFTAEGLLRAYVRGSSRGICHPPSVIHHALLRWLLTQDEQTALEVRLDGWLVKEPALWSRRAPGHTCLSALQQSPRLGAVAQNHSKGCGAVMRVAPCAFFTRAFDIAAESGHLTHGHPTGYLAGGLFADILQRMNDGQVRLEGAVRASLAEHGHKPDMDETRVIVERVLGFHEQGYRPDPQRIDAFAAGWIGEEALAIGLWCALFAQTLEEGVIMAVNHSGDSDSTGLIAGHLLGIEHGVQAIPERWLQRLELREVIEKVAVDIERVPRDYRGYGGEFNEAIEAQYPGG